nr:hypothetical protein [Tanacetum cinerariifolium]
MVAYLSKSDASAEFDQIVDFINAHAIQYALMVNTTIYVSCIKQFWASDTIKKVNDVIQLRTLINGKNVVVTEGVIRQDLRLDDADGVECLPNEEIFAELTHIGYEKPPPKLTTAWNEFSCSMASAVICLATGRKFNFCKCIFDSMVRNVDSPSKFLMYPRFLQVIINSQVDDLTSHNTKYTSLALTQKVFANMRRVETYATLSQKVAELEQDKHTQALEIIKLKKMVQKLEKKSKSSGLKRLRKGRITQEDVSAATKDVNAVEPTVFDDEEEKDDLERAQVLQQQYNDKEENTDWNVVVEQIQEKYLDNFRKYQSLKRKPVSIAQARENMIIYFKNMTGYKMEHFRGMTYDKESFKKLKGGKVSGFESTQETPTNDLKEINWEIHSEGSRSYWKIIRVGGITEAYQSFEDMLKGFNREYLVALWRLVKEKFSSAVPNVDKEKALWVELKRLFKPDAKDVLWKLQRHDTFMLTEKNYPLSNGVMTLMLSAKLQVEKDGDMARDLAMKIFMEANKPKSISLDTSSK